MVSSIILGLTVSAVVFTVINSSNFRLGNDHYRQARILAQEELEDTRFHFLNYEWDFYEDDFMFDYGADAVQVPTSAHQVVSTSDELTPEMSDAVFTPFRVVTSHVTWTENGHAMSVTLYKRIAKLK